MPTNRKGKAYQGSLLLNEQPLYTLPHLAKALGGSDEAMLVQQIHFYLELSRRSGDRRKYNDERWWTYNSFEEWRDGFFIWLSVRTLKRMVRKLVDAGILLIGHFSEMSRDRRNWYSIDYERLYEAILAAYADDQTDPMDSDNVTPSPSGQIDTMQSDNLSPSIVTNWHDVNLIKLLNESTDESLNQPNFRAAKDAARNLVINAQQEGNNESIEESNNSEEEELELTYVDTDEDGNELEAPGYRDIPKWKKPTTDLCIRALAACGRKYFKDKAERSRWIAIEKAMMPLDAAGKVRYPTRYVIETIEWFENKNRNYQIEKGKKGVCFVFAGLLKMLENRERRDDWITIALRNPHNVGAGGPRADDDIYADLPPRITDESLAEDAIGDG